MKLSRRARRMQMHHARRSDKNASLNMVSLMDIFTILVFFLLVSAADSEVLPKPKKISLPESISVVAPKENIIIMIGNGQILVQGKQIATIAEATNQKEQVIPELMAELEQRAKEQGDLTAAATQKRGVTIMGDKQIPYQLLKKVMLSCSRSNFTNISLAVSQKAAEVESPS